MSFHRCELVRADTGYSTISVRNSHGDAVYMGADEARRIFLELGLVLEARTGRPHLRDEMRDGA